MTEKPTQLWELARLVRSKNAGPFTITIDVMFDNRTDYERVRDSGVLNHQLIADLYGVPIDTVRYTEHEAALSLKMSLPRTHSSGALRDTDVFGGQFHGPLVELEV